MKASDLDLVRLALSRGWISPEWHDRALTEADRLQALGLDKSADEVLVEKGVLSRRQARGLRDELGWTPARPRIGGYEVIRRIGLGGMGTVFEARHVRLRKRIALKILLPQYARDPVLAGRFLQEAYALARLNHPHLVHALDAGQDEEYYYLAMEFVEGEDLRQLLGRVKRLEPRRTVEIVSGVCEALEVLEGKGLVHRDIKPANILIDKRGVVKLADLGLLRILEAPGPAGDRFVCGTPQYVSPEQAFHREDIDVRSDLYAVAATWYHLLVGRPPFVGGSSVEVLRAHREKAPPAPSALRRDVPRSVERVILRWLEKDREKRPQSASEALEELRALRSRLDRPRRILSRVLSPARSLRRKGSRLAVVLAVAAVVGLIVLGVALLRERGADDGAGLPGGDRPVGTAGKTPEGRETPSGDTLPGGKQASGSKQAPPEPLPKQGRSEPSTSDPPASRGLARPGPREDPSAPLPLPGGAPSSPVTPPSGPSPSLLDALSARAEEAEALRERVGLLWEYLLRLDRRFDTLRPLAASFHASSVAFEPVGELPGRIALRYRFEGASELDDFRSRSGAWAVLDGRLASLSGGTGEWLDTVAWFTPPVHIRGELEAPATLTIGLGLLRVSPGGAGVGPETAGHVWQQKPGGIAESGRATPAGRGSFSVSFLGNSVEFIGGDRRGRVAVQVPETGRLRIRVGEGQALLWLEIEGTLESTWAGERLRLLQK